MTFNQTDYGNFRVAAVILARNEEQTIREVVQSAAHFVHEVVLMDGCSTDRTAAVARKPGPPCILTMGKVKEPPHARV